MGDAKGTVNAFKDASGSFNVPAGCYKASAVLADMARVPLVVAEPLHFPTYCQACSASDCQSVWLQIAYKSGCITYGAPGTSYPYTVGFSWRITNSAGTKLSTSESCKPCLACFH